jgi:hypothetical protein
MAGYCILRYNERYNTWDVVLCNIDWEEVDVYEADSVYCDKRYVNKIEVTEPKGDAWCY